MPMKFARRVDVGSACVDIWPSPKTHVLVSFYSIYCVVTNNFTSACVQRHKNDEIFEFCLMFGVWLL